jgi:hypothetical protein
MEPDTKKKKKNQIPNPFAKSLDFSNTLAVAATHRLSLYL